MSGPPASGPWADEAVAAGVAEGGQRPDDRGLEERREGQGERLGALVEQDGHLEQARSAAVTLALNVGTEAAVGECLAVEAGGTLLKPATRAEWGGVSGCSADPVGHP